MPLVKFLGVTPEMDEEFRRNFKNTVREAVAAIPEMNITPKDVSVLVFSESGGYDGEIHVEVIFNKDDKRTPAVRRMLASVLTKTTNVFFPNLTLTGCWGDQFNADERGFSIIRKGS